MYDSTPTAREGERIDALVPEVIEATANTPPDAASGPNKVHWRSDEPTVRLLAALVIVEAVVIIGLLAGWALF